MWFKLCSRLDRVHHGVLGEADRAVGDWRLVSRQEFWPGNVPRKGETIRRIPLALRGRGSCHDRHQSLPHVEHQDGTPFALRCAEPLK